MATATMVQSMNPDSPGLQRTSSTTSTKVAENGAPSRGGTLKRKTSLMKRSSVRRSNSRRSVTAGSIRGHGEATNDYNNVFNTPVPTRGNPTEVLADRFQAWRKLLKDLVAYFKEIQTSYETRSKALLKVSNVLNNTTTPSNFMSGKGLDSATKVLRGFHKQSVAEANKSRDIQNDVINQLNGLRSDLGQKIKEIKSLSGDFKNTVDREKDNTRKAVAALTDAVSVAESDPSAASGKNDPYLVKLAVERQVEKQVEEENYLHRAYLNLEGSGRELESIVVGEIQKAYNAYAGILKRESDAGHSTVDELRNGPIAMPKDMEWEAFVENDSSFVNPESPVRQLHEIYYPGKFEPAALEVRAGMLERKSKYLKSYTPGWYVLSATHLHEFKSADHIHTQQPVMSLCLADQKLGSRSQTDNTSHKFSLKGRQSGGMHRGHSWVFRAESYETMMAWYDDIRILTEKSVPERNAFLRTHARSVSGSHAGGAPSFTSDGLEEDEADVVPFGAQQHQTPSPPRKERTDEAVKRPEPGGRFPSDIAVNRPRDTRELSPSSSRSPVGDIAVASGALVNHNDSATKDFASKDPVAAGLVEANADPQHSDGPQHFELSAVSSEPADLGDSSAAAPVAAAGTVLPLTSGAAGTEPVREAQKDDAKDTFGSVAATALSDEVPKTGLGSPTLEQPEGLSDGVNKTMHETARDSLASAQPTTSLTSPPLASPGLDSLASSTDVGGNPHIHIPGEWSRTGSTY